MTAAHLPFAAAQDSACCHHSAVPLHPAHAPAPHGVQASWGAAAQVTLHCLTGCALGEWMGLALGVSLGWSSAATIVLAVTLAFVCGFALTLAPLVRRGLPLRQALRIIWLGEFVSIAVMELVMNLVDYQLGGMGPGMSLLHGQYWLAFAAAAVAGYFAAWPVNYVLLRRNLKSCHAAMELG